MNTLLEKSYEIQKDLIELQMFMKCLLQCVDFCCEDVSSDCAHIFLLAKLINEKFANLVNNYDKFNIEIYQDSVS